MFTKLYSFFATLITSILIIDSIECQSIDKFPEIRKCVGEITFRTTTFINWEISVYANSSGTSQLDCAEKCYERLEFCKTTKFDRVRRVCLYSYKWNECFDNVNDNATTNARGLPPDMASNDVIFCVKCSGVTKQQDSNRDDTPSVSDSKKSPQQAEIPQSPKSFHLLSPPSTIDNSGVDQKEDLKPSLQTPPPWTLRTESTRPLCPNCSSTVAPEIATANVSEPVTSGSDNDSSPWPRVIDFEEEKDFGFVSTNSTSTSKSAFWTTSPRSSTAKSRRASILGRILKTLEKSGDWKSMPFLNNLNINAKSNLSAVNRFTSIDSQPSKFLHLDLAEDDRDNSKSDNDFKTAQGKKFDNGFFGDDDKDSLEKSDNDELQVTTETPRRRNSMSTATLLWSRLQVEPRDVTKKMINSSEAEKVEAKNSSLSCSTFAALPCSLKFGRNCRMQTTVDGCDICTCPFRSPASGCAGPDPIVMSSFERTEMLMGRKKCPNGRASQRVTRYYRKVSSSQDDCVSIQDTYCGWDMDVGAWRMPRSKEECYFYCFSEDELNQLSPKS